MDAPDKSPFGRLYPASPACTVSSSDSFFDPFRGEKPAVEEWDEYRPGGYHPVEMGDRYGDGRYEVVQKLGHGRRSTVWLCLDAEAHRENLARGFRPARAQWVALKILKARLSSVLELRVRDRLDQQPGEVTRAWRSRYVLRYLDAFDLEGPNGRHCCLVMPLTGGPISTGPRGLDRREPDLMTAMCQKIALGLEYLHDRGICHGSTSHTRVSFVGFLRSLLLS